LLEKSEIEIINGCVKEDRQSQKLLYQKFANTMMAICYRYSRNKEDAEDSLTEGFMKVFEKISTFKNEGSFEGWVKRIFINHSLEKLRKNGNIYKVLHFDDYENEQDSGEDIESNLNAKELIELIQKLPPIYQMVFNLYVFDGKKHKEIAEELKISIGTSKSNLFDARKWLKKELEKLNRNGDTLTA
jgi:RNA polymerase sigma factor (sigma-70 family)